MRWQLTSAEGDAAVLLRSDGLSATAKRGASVVEVVIQTGNLTRLSLPVETPTIKSALRPVYGELEWFDTDHAPGVVTLRFRPATR